MFVEIFMRLISSPLSIVRSPLPSAGDPGDYSNIHSFRPRCSGHFNFLFPSSFFLPLPFTLPQAFLSPHLFTFLSTFPQPPVSYRFPCLPFSRPPLLLEPLVPGASFLPPEVAFSLPESSPRSHRETPISGSVAILP